MPSYDGAVAAIQQRLRDHWTTTDIGFQNGADPVKADITGVPIPWVYCEVLTTTSSIRGGATETKQSWLYMGLIHVHVFVPVGSGDVVAQAYATQIGEIFRNKRFYDADPMSPPGEWGAQVRTWAPRADGGDSGSDDGVWWRMTCTVPFHIYLQA